MPPVVRMDPDTVAEAGVEGATDRIAGAAGAVVKRQNERRMRRGGGG